MFTDVKSCSDISANRRCDARSISLWALFQVLTACCIFLAVLRLSPTLALIVTIIVGPAVVRTAWISELHRRQKREFDWVARCRFFAGSVAVMTATVCAGLLTFVAISAGFGLLGLLFGAAISSFEMGFEAAVLGTVGGMIWGMGGGFLAMCFAACKLWNPVLA